MKPVSQTAWYCCGVRMTDAESKNPLTGDGYAKLFMGDEGLAYWQEFRHFKAPVASNIARHYLIDAGLQELLARQPASTVILVGAGFDSRAFRFNTGEWIEIDEPAVIERKNEILPPIKCSNTLTRIAIDFTTEKLSDKLAPYSTRENIIIVLEGVLMYLTDAEKKTLLDTLTALFPKHHLFCDIMSRYFFDKVGHRIHKHFAMHGSPFKDLHAIQEALYLSYGYTLIDVQSTIRTASGKGIFPAPKFIVRMLPRKLVDGFNVYHFAYKRQVLLHQ